MNTKYLIKKKDIDIDIHTLRRDYQYIISEIYPIYDIINDCKVVISVINVNRIDYVQISSSNHDYFLKITNKLKFNGKPLSLLFMNGLKLKQVGSDCIRISFWNLYYLSQPLKEEKGGRII